jgi:hypothetical protein
MLRLKGRGKGIDRAGLFFVALLTIAAILWIAWPVAANAAPDELWFQDDNGTSHKLTFNVSASGNVTAVMIDNTPVTPSTSNHTKGVRQKVNSAQSREAVVFWGNSTCIFVAGRWIGYPPGTTCP